MFYESIVVSRCDSFRAHFHPIWRTWSWQSSRRYCPVRIVLREIHSINLCPVNMLRVRRCQHRAGIQLGCMYVAAQVENESAGNRARHREHEARGDLLQRRVRSGQ